MGHNKALSCRQRGAIDQIYSEDTVRDEFFVMPDFHYHLYYELFYVVKGSCRCFIGDNVSELYEGCGVIIPPECPHYTRYKRDCRRFSVYFRVKDVDEEVRVKILPHITGDSPWIFRVPAAWQGDLMKMIDRMDAEERLQDEKSGIMRRFLLQEFLVQCARHGLIEEESPADIHTDVDGILQAAKYMTGHYEQKLTQDMLAKISGYSPNYFSRRFKETTGMGAHEYLQIIRLKNAAEKLRTTEESVLEVALSVGFNDANYFKDAFKKMYGLSPRNYRKSTR